MLVFHNVTSHRENIRSWELKNRAFIFHLNAIPRFKNICSRWFYRDSMLTCVFKKKQLLKHGSGRTEDFYKSVFSMAVFI